MRILRTSVAAFAVLLLNAPAQGDDARRATGDEIRSKILGHSFRSDHDEGNHQSTLRIFLSADGKLLGQLDVDNEPALVAIETYELKDDRLCLHDLGLMPNAEPDQCYAAFMTTTESGDFRSGYLDDDQNHVNGVALDMAFDDDAREIEARWAKWESIRQEVGTIDAFAPMDEVATNPFRFKGKVQIVVGDFQQMVDSEAAWIRTKSGQALIVKGISNELFKQQGQGALIVGEFTGTMQVTRHGDAAFLPVITAKATRLCGEARCRDFLDY